MFVQESLSQWEGGVGWGGVGVGGGVCVGGGGGEGAGYTLDIFQWK